MITVSDYRFVYENWYWEECRKTNEKPLPFSIYLKTTQISTVEFLKKHLEKKRNIK